MQQRFNILKKPKLKDLKLIRNPDTKEMDAITHILSFIGIDGKEVDWDEQEYSVVLQATTYAKEHLFPKEDDPKPL